MKLTTKQQEIVQAISDGEITDILSFVKHYGFGEEICFDKEEVKRKFDEEYSGKKFLCDVKHYDIHDIQEGIIERVDNHTAYCKANLSFSGACSRCSCSDVSYTYGLFDPVHIIAKDMPHIISFIALWQYLKSQALIIELPKSCSSEDMGLFLNQVTGSNRREISLDENSTTPYAYYHLDVSYTDFFDGKYELDVENFEICYPYLTKKIYAAPELKTFIQEKYRTAEEINTRNNFRIALAGVVIAIVTSALSIWTSTRECDYSSELNKMVESLQEMQTIINDAIIEEKALLQEIIDAQNDSTEDMGDSVELKEIADSLQDILKVLSDNAGGVPEDTQ